MKQRTLVSDRRYFGLDALALRAAACRVAARVAGLAPGRARVRGAFLRQDFGVDTVDGRALLDDLCADGLLARPGGPTSDFIVTPRLIEFVPPGRDRKSTRLDSSHLVISDAFFCL